MREIKFRVWNDVKGRYLALVELMQLQTNLQTPIEYNAMRFTSCDINKFELFTGLTDKNGVEIYEGDILKAISNNSMDRSSYRFRIYVGIDGAFRYEQQYERDGKWNRRASQTVNSLVSEKTKEYYDVEVIGNVHNERV